MERTVNEHRPSGHDVIVVVPPLSPNGTNPPLGPALLRTALERRDLSVGVCDLNREFFQEETSGTTIGHSSIVGDHDKDRGHLRIVREEFRRLSADLRPHSTQWVPPCADAFESAAFDFDELQQCVERAAAAGQPLREWLETHLFRKYEAPRVLGISIMGARLVLVANLIARLAREIWPRTTVIGGGTHVTALRHELQRDAGYGRYFHAFFPGHCENEFAAFVKAGGQVEALSSTAGSIVAGHEVCFGTDPSDPRKFEVTGTFDEATCSSFTTDEATMPAQLTRGCIYGRCTMCVYTDVERGYVTASNGMEKLVALIERNRCRRVSIKDSFVTKSNLAAIRDGFTGLPQEVLWSATTMIQPGLIEPGFLASLHGSGCRTLEFGVETIHPRGQALLAKRMELGLIRRVVLAAAEAGIHVIVNLIYGLPGETHAQARRQLRWFRGLAARVPGKISGSHNMLEINLGSRIAATPEKYGVELRGRAPWAFSFDWNAPEWSLAFKHELDQFELECESGPPATIVLITGPGGAGKTTLANALCELPRIHRWLSLTTRPSRQGDSIPREYEHVSVEEFDRRHASDQLIEEPESVGGHRYGLPVPNADHHAAVEVAIVSANRCECVRSAMEARGCRVVVVFVDAADTELVRRMKHRGDSDEEIELRRARNACEREFAGQADLVIRECSPRAALEAVLRTLNM